MNMWIIFLLFSFFLIIPLQAYAATAPDSIADLHIVYSFDGTFPSWTAPYDGGSPITDYFMYVGNNPNVRDWQKVGGTIDDNTWYPPEDWLENISYPVGITAVNAIGESKILQYIDFTLHTRPTPPTNFMIHDSYLGITLSFYEPEFVNDHYPITEYILEYREVSSDTWIKYDGSDDVNFYKYNYPTLDDLTLGVEYAFQVFAVSAVGASDPTETIFGTPYCNSDSTIDPCLTDMLDPPSKFEVSQLGRGILILSGANAVNANAVNANAGVIDYFVEYSDDGGSNWIVFDNFDNIPDFFHILDIKIDVEYSIRMFAANDSDTSPPSDVKLITTVCNIGGPIDECELGRPTITEINSLDGKINLVWDAPHLTFTNLPIIHNIIQFSDDNVNWIVADNGELNTATSITIDNLTNDVEYFFKIAAVTDYGGGLYLTVTATPSLTGGSEGGSSDEESPPIFIAEKKSGGGCGGDCQEPTLGVNNDGKRLVTDGFSYNGNFIDVEHYFTPYPLVTVDVGVENVAQFKIYDNGGPDNVAHFELAFGLSKGQSIGDSKAVINWDKSWDDIETVTIDDPENALENVTVTTSKGSCSDELQQQCLIVKILHTFRTPLEFNILGSNVWDYKRNAWQNYYNHGIKVVGDSLNPMITQMIPGPVKYEGLIKVTQSAKYSDVWIADDGRIFESNDMDTMRQINQTIQYGEYDGSDKYREHPNFKLNLISEGIRANLILENMCSRCNDESFDKINNIFGYDERGIYF